MKILSTFSSFLLLMCLVSCGNKSDHNLDIENSYILNPISDVTFALTTTVSLNYDQCSGIKISPTHIIFAAHCIYVDGYEILGYPQYYPEEIILIKNHKNKIKEYKVRRLYIHKSYRTEVEEKITQGARTEDAGRYSSDVAIIELEDEIQDVNIAKIDFSKVDSKEDGNDDVVITGVGSIHDKNYNLISSDKINNGKTKLLNISNIFENMVKEKDLINVQTRYIFTKGTLYDNLANSGLSYGDSGGGLFKDDKLIGINSFIFTDSEKYTHLHGHTRLDKLKEWISEILIPL